MLSYIYQTRILEGGDLHGMAGLCLFLGMRYMCVLRGYADRKA